MFARVLLGAAVLLQCAGAFAFAEEERDWGVAPTREIRQPPYTAPTPVEIPGARWVRTEELKTMLVRKPLPLLIDVASGEGHFTLKDALWMPGAGRGGHYLDPVQAGLAERLAELTSGDKSRPIVFFCVNAQCWLSYNASLRAVALGYTRVHWYRGGVEAWRAAGLPLERVRRPIVAAPVSR